MLAPVSRKLPVPSLVNPPFAITAESTNSGEAIPESTLKVRTCPPRSKFPLMLACSVELSDVIWPLVNVPVPVLTDPLPSIVNDAIPSERLFRSSNPPLRMVTFEVSAISFPLRSSMRTVALVIKRSPGNITPLSSSNTSVPPLTRVRPS